jgi:hypothetical protein
LGVIFAGKELIDQDPGADLAVGVVVVALVVTVVFPILFVRFPLAGHFTWFLSRAVASVFRAELAALSRADEGTFLARLISGAGKK